jgi:hypothetical protein
VAVCSALPVVRRMVYGPALAVKGTKPDIAAADQIRPIASTMAVPISMRLSICISSVSRPLCRVFRLAKRLPYF